MLGVVIWTCQNSGRAIIWCSDHRELAHFDGKSDGHGPVMKIEVGDLVEATFMPTRPIRRCTSLKLVEANYMPSVATELTARPHAIAAA